MKKSEVIKNTGYLIKHKNDNVIITRIEDAVDNNPIPSDFTNEDKEWINKIDSSTLTTDDIL